MTAVQTISLPLWPTGWPIDAILMSLSSMAGQPFSRSKRRKWFRCHTDGYKRNRANVDPSLFLSLGSTIICSFLFNNRRSFLSYWWPKEKKEVFDQAFLCFLLLDHFFFLLLAHQLQERKEILARTYDLLLFTDGLCFFLFICRPSDGKQEIVKSLCQDYSLDNSLEEIKNRKRKNKSNFWWNLSNFYFNFLFLIISSNESREYGRANHSFFSYLLWA